LEEVQLFDKEYEKLEKLTLDFSNNLIEDFPELFKHGNLR